MGDTPYEIQDGIRRSPRGERGLKFGFLSYRIVSKIRRSPRGERGLKFAPLDGGGGGCFVAPPRGAWIEIRRHRTLTT